MLSVENTETSSLNIEPSSTPLEGARCNEQTVATDDATSPEAPADLKDIGIDIADDSEENQPIPAAAVNDGDDSKLMTDSDKIRRKTGMKNPAFSREKSDVAADDTVNGEQPISIVESSANDDKILSVLREIVRKCTNADPMKRPSADEIVHMLKM
ncbi:uncharacterized protein LOC141911648 [Tubulanus polymorphus]|uniref:uncharacterized protein LOC141911648 n=1 Tax=Tubulanus polymorphus TaxID=672921 RepID=UPI003DA2DD8A